MRSALRHSLAALAVALCSAVCGCSAPGGDERRKADTVPVVRVVDGDTIRVGLRSGEEPVRYIGIDTPESVKPGAPVECFAKRATAYNERLVAGERIRLVYDVERRDRYGRLLAYVYRARDGLFVNADWSAAATRRRSPSRPTSRTSASSGGWPGGHECPDADFGRGALVRAE